MGRVTILHEEKDVVKEEFSGRRNKMQCAGSKTVVEMARVWKEENRAVEKGRKCSVKKKDARGHIF